MAQDDRKGTPGSRGKAPGPTAPDTPSTRDINPPPAPEKPVTQPTDAGPPAAAQDEAADGNEGQPMAGAAATDADSGAGDDASEEKPPVDETDDLEKAVKAAKAALQEKEEALARYKEKREAEAAAARLVDEYAAEEDALNAASHDLDQYREAEISFLGQFLDSTTKDKIAAAAKTAQAEIDELAGEIGDQEEIVATKRKARDEAKNDALAAQRNADALKRPAASIRDQLKAADSIRSEAKKASDEGKYSLAYWLVMPSGKLDQAIKAAHILKHDDLRDLVKTTREAQEKADQALADREKELKEAEDKLRDERVRLVDLRKKFDATVLENVAKLNPPIVKAA